MFWSNQINWDFLSIFLEILYGFENPLCNINIVDTQRTFEVLREFRIRISHFSLNSLCRMTGIIISLATLEQFLQKRWPAARHL